MLVDDKSDRWDILDAAVARFHHYNQLELELKNARRQLTERKTIDKAKGIIIRKSGLSEEQAYQAMRKLAMDTNRKVAAVAQNIHRGYQYFLRVEFLLHQEWPKPFSRKAGCAILVQYQTSYHCLDPDTIHHKIDSIGFF